MPARSAVAQGEAVIEAAEGPGWRRLALLIAAYPLAWILLEELSTPLAFWPVALRFLLLWSLPVRHWPAVALVDVGSAVVARHLFQGEPLFGVGPWLISLAPVLVYAMMIRVVRGRAVPGTPDAPVGMSRLLGAAALCTFGVAPLLATYLGLISGPSTDGLDALLGFGFGDLFGVVVLAPAALALRGGAMTLWRSRRWGFEAALAFAVTLGVMSLAHHRPSLDEHLLLIMFLPTVMLAFRHGWQGAAWSLAVLGALLAAGFSAHPDPLRLQVMTAVVGGAALLLGAAASQLREQRETVEAQHAALRLALFEQRELAGRIVALEDEGQRQVAESLHEQVAPPLQELRTLLAMARRGGADEHHARLVDTLRGHTWQVQDGLERALRRLQPPALARGDLQALLAHGPLWEWAQEQGVDWHVTLAGPVQTLPERWRAVLYRIAQAGLEQGLVLGARNCRLTIVATGGTGSVDLALDLDLELAGPLPAMRLAIDAIQDRTLAAGGHYRCEPTSGGCRHSVRFVDVATIPG